MLSKIVTISPHFATQDRQSQRLVATYQTASLVICAVSLVWLAFFVVRQWWAIAAFELCLGTVGFVSWLLIRSGRLNAALLFSELAFLALTVFFCLIFDVPSEAVPRVSHLFLLVLAMLGYINYVRGRAWPQLAIVLSCLGFFVAFSSATLAFPFAQPLPDEVRLVGAWVNATVATALLCGSICMIQIELTRRNGMVRELEAALRNDELELFFQPVVDSAGSVIGAEALLRWNHPARGYVGPGEFIPMLEENGMMPRFGAWVLKEACRTLACWQEDPQLGRLTLAVNVSADQFMVDGFDDFVLDTVRLHDVAPERLMLELTESVVVAGVDTLIPKMNALRAAGIGFALDDFGTGYSSLSYLQQLPIDQLKIDRSFVQDGQGDARGGALVKSIVQIGRDLGLVVLAEGVETRAQHEFMLACGCSEFQGFHFGRPVPRADFEAFARASMTMASTSKAVSRRRRRRSVGMSAGAA